MRAERAKLKSQRDNMKVAQRKRGTSAALGWIAKRKGGSGAFFPGAANSEIQRPALALRRGPSGGMQIDSQLYSVEEV